jgi:hypothetical protein
MHSPDGGPAILALLTPMGPGGLRVHAIHRVVPDLTLEEALAGAARGFQVADLGPAGDGAADVADEVRRRLADPRESGLLVTDGRRLARLTAPTAEVLASVPADAPPAWRGLDVVLAHHGLFARLWGRGDDPESVQVAHTVEEAVARAVAQRGVAVLLRGPSPADVAAVARADARMPRKSTLFVPKPRTGLVLRPHAD